jgi:hypothetical protein
MSKIFFMHEDKQWLQCSIFCALSEAGLSSFKRQDNLHHCKINQLIQLEKGYSLKSLIQLEKV